MSIIAQIISAVIAWIGAILLTATAGNVVGALILKQKRG